MGSLLLYNEIIDGISLNRGSVAAAGLGAIGGLLVFPMPSEGTRVDACKGGSLRLVG
jgi:hypothetical protein